MPMRVIITTEAEGDLLSHTDWIAKDSPVNAIAVARELRAKIATLRQYPRSGRPAVERRFAQHELRQISLRPYRIVYAIFNETVWVLHVRHSSQQFLRRSELRIGSMVE